MKKEDDTTEPEGDDRDQPELPATPPASPGAEVEEPDASQPAADAGQPDSLAGEHETTALEPDPDAGSDPVAESDSATEPPAKKSSVKRFFILFLGVLFLGLSAAVYFLATERATTLNTIQDKLAHLDSQLSAIQQGGSAGSPGTDLAVLRQEFQAFRKQTLASLGARQATVAAPAHEPEHAVEEHEPTAHDESEHAVQEHESAAHEAEHAVEEHDVAASPIPPVAHDNPPYVASPVHHDADSKPKAVSGETVERSQEVQEYINLVESAFAEVSRIVRKGLATLWDYLVALLG